MSADRTPAQRRPTWASVWSGLLARAVQVWLAARYSFWLWPAAMVAAAIGLAAGLVELDARIGPLDAAATSAHWSVLTPGSADGARGLLQTIAGAMITVAGVVFSITLVALSLAASQYTPRVLRNFMRDRVNQTVLGAFVGIYAYCLVVLRTIRGGTEGGDDFVPGVAVLAGMGLGLAGMAVLIYFIHHIARSIQAGQILSAVTADTLRAADTLYPKDLQDDDDAPLADDDRPGRWQAVPAPRSGYVQVVDTDALLDLARAHDLELRVRAASGRFVVAGRPLLAWARRSPEAVEAGNVPGDDLAAAFAIGEQRTVEQDLRFGLRQIVDLALKALSPGINDTTTAVMCVHRLREILWQLADRPLPADRCDADGCRRVVGCGPDFAALLAVACDQIRQCAAGNVAVLSELIALLECLADGVRRPARRAALRDQLRRLARACRRTVADPQDRAPLVARTARLRRRLSGVR